MLNGVGAGEGTHNEGLCVCGVGWVQVREHTMRVCVCTEWGGGRREHTLRVCVRVARVVVGPVKCLWRKLTFQPYRKNTVASFHLPFTWPEQFSFLILTSPLTPPLFLSLSLLFLCACLPVSPPSPKLPCLVCHL